MTPPFPMPVPGQRAAEEFDSVLAGRTTAEVSPEVLARYSGLVATVQLLRDQPDVMPRAAFVADLRERLMVAAEADLVAAPPVVRRLPERSPRRRRLATAAAALVMVGGTAGMAAAAEGALPGESLYPIKRGIEQISVGVRLDEASKGTALLGQADERLDELESLMGRGADATLVASTMRDFRSSADAGAGHLFTAFQSDSDAADITTVRDFTSQAMSRVAALATGADADDQAGLRDLADVLADIDQQAAVFCAACGEDALATPTELVSSPLAVESLIARPAELATADVARAREARLQADQEALAGLQDRAQGQADGLSSGTSEAGTTVSETITGTVTSAGKVVPSATEAARGAVKGLVGGITGAVGAGTGKAGASSGLEDAGKAVEDTVDAVTGTVDDVTGSVLGKKNK